MMGRSRYEEAVCYPKKLVHEVVGVPERKDGQQSVRKEQVENWSA